MVHRDKDGFISGSTQIYKGERENRTVTSTLFLIAGYVIVVCLVFLMSLYLLLNLPRFATTF
jgi:hypothetical protein